MKLRGIIVFIAALLLLITPAEARHRHHHKAAVRAAGGFWLVRPHRAPAQIKTTSDHDSVIGGRPAGCPRAFCGCGASLYLYGKIIPALNRAAEWFKFPRAEPAPGMAAVRRHHVMVLLRPTDKPGVWVVHDSNSGHHLTRVHERDISRYRIVAPQI